MNRFALSRSISRMPMLVAITALGLALSTNAGVAARLCTPAEIDEFSRLYLTVDRTKNTCRRILVRAEAEEVDLASACRACAAAVEAEERLSSWFVDNPECAESQHSEEIMKTFEGPLEILRDRCGP